MDIGMSFKCEMCGEVHEDAPSYLLFRAPEAATGRVLDVQYDHESMSRTESRFFVRCDIPFPITPADDGPLGFVCWVEVGQREYERLLGFRESGKPRSVDGSCMSGKLANHLTDVPGSYGTEVKFEVVAVDPTPYVVWVAPGSALAARLRTGPPATLEQEARSRGAATRRRRSSAASD